MPRHTKKERQKKRSVPTPKKPQKRKPIPKRKRAAVGAKISKLKGEGKPLDQAVAIALDMARRGEI